MRDYAKVAPQFWTGKTGKALKAKGPRAVVVAMYLLTNPHANMLGLYYLPVMYVAHETGLGMEGASKGLQWACEAGFCSYDEASEMVWVREMASYQIADELKPGDKRTLGVQKDYDALPDNPFLEAFYARYAVPFGMTRARSCEATQNDDSDKPLQSPFQAPPKPGTGTGTGTGTGEGVQGEPPAAPSGPPVPPAEAGKPAKPKAVQRTFDTWVQQAEAAGEKPIPNDHVSRQYAMDVGIPPEFLRLHWHSFRRRFSGTSKKYTDWGLAFLNSLKGNWYKLWAIDAEGGYFLTTAGKQAEREHQEAR